MERLLIILAVLACVAAGIAVVSMSSRGRRPPLRMERELDTGDEDLLIGSVGAPESPIDRSAQVLDAQVLDGEPVERRDQGSARADAARAPGHRAMRLPPHGAVLLLCLGALATSGGPVSAQAPATPPAEQGPPVAPPTPASQPCGARAARYESGKGFDLVVTRAGQIRVENPLRPLTPEVNHVLQVVIAGKVATAYGPDFDALRRGGSPAAVEAMLGGPIRWEPALPVLPDPIAVVAEDGARLADLSFRDCQAPPAVKAPPQARTRAPAKNAAGAHPGAKSKAAVKAPPGFSVPQGAIAE